MNMVTNLVIKQSWLRRSHVASALAARSAISGLALLSLDSRVRENGAALGFDVFPE